MPARKGVIFKAHREPASVNTSTRTKGRTYSACSDSVQLQKLNSELAATNRQLAKAVSGNSDPNLLVAREVHQQEQSELMTKLVASRPSGLRLREMGEQITKQQKLRDAQRKKLQVIEERLAQLQEREAQATSQLAELDQQTL
ncbi:unnamed protein product, partial [Prorocentrum cordatum]